MGMPIVAVVDTNCNPEGITYPIPGNDDAIRAITLFTQIIANAVIEAENEVGPGGHRDAAGRRRGSRTEEFADAPGRQRESAASGKFDGRSGDGARGRRRSGRPPPAARKPGFTDEDYSNYTPEEQEAQGWPAKPGEDLVEKNVVDEDKLYEE